MHSELHSRCCVLLMEKEKNTTDDYGLFTSKHSTEFQLTAHVRLATLNHYVQRNAFVIKLIILQMDTFHLLLYQGVDKIKNFI